MIMHPLITFSNSSYVFCGSSSLWGHPVWLSLETSLSAVWDKAVSMTNHITNFLLERTEAEAETPTLWPPDVKNWLIWKDPDAGKD